MTCFIAVSGGMRSDSRVLSQDPQIPADKIKQFEGILGKKTSPTKSKFYPGSHHGFVIRGDESDPKQAEQAADALGEIATYFKAY